MYIVKDNAYPSGAVLNLAPHAFIFEGIQCGSVEGPLQAFKFSNPDM